MQEPTRWVNMMEQWIISYSDHLMLLKSRLDRDPKCIYGKNHCAFNISIAFWIENYTTMVLGLWNCFQIWCLWSMSYYKHDWSCIFLQFQIWAFWCCDTGHSGFLSVLAIWQFQKLSDVRWGTFQLPLISWPEVRSHGGAVPALRAPDPLQLWLWLQLQLWLWARCKM